MNIVAQKDEPRLNKFRTWHILILLLFIAFALRLVLLLQPEVIHNDGTDYISHAKEVLAGNWMGGRSGPVYPALIALAYTTLIRNYELAGILVSVIFGTLLVLPVFYLGKEIFEREGRRAFRSFNSRSTFSLHTFWVCFDGINLPFFHSDIGSYSVGGPFDRGSFTMFFFLASLPPSPI